jgi:hypothetical protein
LAPAHPPLAFAVTPPGGLDGVLRTSAMDPGGFCFYVRRAFVVARYEAGKILALQVAKKLTKKWHLWFVGNLVNIIKSCHSIRCRILKYSKKLA